MFGLGGMNPKKMQGIMSKMGISQEQVDASKVIIEKSDSSNITINNPSVVKISMQGQETFQVSGDISEATSISEEDIKTVAEKTGKSEAEAKAALEETGDLAEAIMKLS